MKIRLTKITLTNFKGIRSQQFDFNDATTIIGGANGTGKTTIFDAFIWCLFGKDCQDHKQFSIKTLNPDGTPINRLPHEVEVELLADKQPIRLKRTYTEKWQKKRGAVEEEFTGHEEGRFYNDVPMSVAEYAEKINSICKEDVFKMVTNPHYFLAQKDEVIRAMLFRMAGDVTPDEIVKENPELSELLDKLQGKSVEEYRREVLAQCKRLKDELKAVPIRMEEVQRNMPEEKDTKELQKQQTKIKKEIEKVEACMEDKSQAYQEQNKQNLAQMKALADAENELKAYEFEQRMKVQEEYRDQRHKQSELKSQADYYNKCIEQVQAEKEKLLVLQHECDDKRNELLAEFQAVRENELVFEDDMFICPTCKRPFETNDIEARKQEMTEHFNEAKANHLKQINIDGQANNERKFKICKQVDEKDDLIEDYQNKLEEIQAEPLYSKDLTIQPDYEAYKVTEQFAVLYQKVQDLKQQQQQQSTMPDLSEYKAQKAELMAQLENVQNDIVLVSTRNTQLTRLEELKQQQQTLNQQLAQYEREDYHVQQYQKARANMVTTKINSLFTCVWFKLYDTQINGGEVECCKAMINGVPYSDANNAAKINAGLDIINAICKYEDITAPIFIDNAESVNNILPTNSQQIRLVVTTDKTLKTI